MNIEEFTRRVLIAGREMNDQEYLEHRLDEYLDIEGNREFFQNDVCKFISGIGRIKKLPHRKSTPQAENPVPEEKALKLEEDKIAQFDSQRNEILGLAWQRIIKQDVEKIRMELFGKKGAPFYNDSRAAEIWIKSKVDNPCLEFVNEYNKLDKMLCEKHLFFQKKFGLSLTFGKSKLVLEYKNASGKIEWAKAWTNVDLYKLCNFVIEFSEGTGFEESEITSHILTGISFIKQLPYITRIRNFRVLISSPLESPEQAKSLYDQLRIESFLTGRHALNKKDLWLYKLVEANGGAPTTGKRGRRNDTSKFWKEIQVEHNKKYSKQWISWETPKKRYEFIMKRVNINQYVSDNSALLSC